eukprot:767039-Hanusia_phi.AAC.2
MNKLAMFRNSLPSLLFFSLFIVSGQWAWKLLFAISFLLSAPRIYRAPPPDPDQILLHASPASCTECREDRTRKGISRRGLEDVIKHVMGQQIRRGSQVGMSVSVFLEGEELASVCGGVYRPVGARSSWKPVTKDTIFMSYSVCKGVSATALLTCVDRDECKFEQRVSEIWPAFSQGGKDDVIISDAVSHRSGMPGMSFPVVLVHSLSSLLGWRRAWKEGLRFVEAYIPEWQPGKFASYHFVSFSWIIGGIVEKAANMHIHNVVISRIAKVLQVGEDMFLGLLPADKKGRTAMLEYPPHPFFEKHPISSMRDALLRITAILETKVFAGVANSHTWRNFCLPSSNGFFTAYSVGEMR